MRCQRLRTIFQSSRSSICTPTSFSLPTLEADFQQGPSSELSNAQLIDAYISTMNFAEDLKMSLTNTSVCIDSINQDGEGDGDWTGGEVRSEVGVLGVNTL